MTRNEKFSRWFRDSGLGTREMEKYGISKTTVSRITNDLTAWRDRDSEVEAAIVRAMGTTWEWWRDDTAGFPMPVAGTAGAYYLTKPQLALLAKAEDLAGLAGETDGSLKRAQQRLFGLTAGEAFDIGKGTLPDQDARPGRKRPGSAG